jgi:WS/DGAT/MGAT family acyltransferase
MSIDRLSALDRLMLWASRRWPQDIGALAILDGGPLLDDAGQFRIDAVRDALERRLHLVPRFRRLIHQPRRGLGGPLWVDAPTFDLTHHVRLLPLEPPAGEAELLAAVEEILRQRLDPGHPLWEMWLLPGLPDRRVGLFVRIHHAIADGMAAMATLAALLETTRTQPPATPLAWAPAPWPTARALIADNLARRLRALARGLAALAHPRATLRGMLAAWPAIREILAEEPATRTSLDRIVGPDRSLALIRTSLAEVKEVGRAHDATVNDVLLAATAAGLRALLEARGEPVERTTVRIYVPVSLRRHLRGRQQGNLIAQMAVPLRLGQADPGRRLADIAAETDKRKARVRTSLSNLMVGGAIGRRLMLLAVMRQRVNATSASIPGPKEPLYLAGARILEVFPLLPLVANEPLGVGALSYAGALSIGIAADRDGLPDLDVLAGAMGEELQSLGLPTYAALAGDAAAATAPSARPAAASRVPTRGAAAPRAGCARP